MSLRIPIHAARLRPEDEKLAKSSDFWAWYGSLSKSGVFQKVADDAAWDEKDKDQPISSTTKDSEPDVDTSQRELPSGMTADEMAAIMAATTYEDFSKLGAVITLERREPTSPRPSSSVGDWPHITEEERESMRQERSEYPPQLPGVKVIRDDFGFALISDVSFRLEKQQDDVWGKDDSLFDTGAVDTWISLEYFPKVEQRANRIFGLPYKVYRHEIEFRIPGIEEKFCVEAMFTAQVNMPGQMKGVVLGQRGWIDRMKYFWRGRKLSEDNQDLLVLMEFRRRDNTCVKLYGLPPGVTARNEAGS
ncbi:hypothetical protein TWF696_006455 [Orbilia brochopaga]|uniref:Uncharacterized protein n=1 Tax=Orbilia brochopaga TaxID=3140254 RepID=A0AAV9UZF6_9PEZI